MNFGSPKITDVLKELGLKPTTQTSQELRFGTRGSLCVNIAENNWYDHEQNVGGGAFALIEHKGAANSKKEAAQWCKDRGLICHSPNSSKAILREHVYKDLSGGPIQKAIKYTNGSWRQKRFENGAWQFGVKGTINLPYGLDRLVADYSDKLCFVFEGEKDVELALESGPSATCNVGGAGKWRDELNEPLNGRTVCIVPDNDEAGVSHAKNVEVSLKRCEIQCFVSFNWCLHADSNCGSTDYKSVATYGSASAHIGEILFTLCGG